MFVSFFRVLFDFFLEIIDLGLEYRCGGENIVKIEMGKEGWDKIG